MASFEFREVGIEAEFQVHRSGSFIVQVALRPNPADPEQLTFKLSLNSVVGHQLARGPQ
jgi:hypothetical protein